MNVFLTVSLSLAVLVVTLALCREVRLRRALQLFFRPAVDYPRIVC
ncbi:MAG: hypothetical protein HY000_15055 [Planctomycetes bacterium]|nr:hypothetical protein [Planctomycetota bacterium]